jgi:outer membrane lipoprotein SlyB
VKSRSIFPALCVLPVLALGACTVATPTGPSVVAMPGPGKTFSQFQQDDAACRAYAAERNSAAAGAAANAQSNATLTTIAGTLLGAATGAAVGSLGGNAGAGAAVGAGAGLLGGAAVAGDQTQNTANSLQGQYDISYTQCMVGHGEVMQSPPPQPVDADPVDAVGYPPVYGGTDYVIIDGVRHYRYDDHRDFGHPGLYHGGLDRGGLRVADRGGYHGAPARGAPVRTAKRN